MLKIWNWKKLMDTNLDNKLTSDEIFPNKYTEIKSNIIALKISIFYIIIGGLWILLSDRILELLIRDIKKIQLFQTYKGWLYILITGVILFLMIKKSLLRMKLVSNKLYQSYEELNLAYEELIATEEDLKNRVEELKLSREALAESEERYQLAVEASNDGIWDRSPKKRGIYFSSRCKEILGYDDLNGFGGFEDFKKLLHPDDKEHALKIHEDYINRRRDDYTNIYRLKTKQGQYKWILSRGKAIWDENGKLTRMVGSFTDITEQKRNEEKILNLAYYDLITGLPNRTMFEKELDFKIVQANKSNSKMALLYFDLDNFKNVNDTLGHTYGDKILKLVAKELLKHKKEKDIIARLGGDEFALLVSDLENTDKIHNIANEIIKALDKPWVLRAQNFYISTSIGIAIFPEHGEDYQNLLKNADTAMYSAKEKGKKHYEIYKEEMYIEKIKFINMEKSLRHGIKNNEFILNYQPMIDLNNEDVIGAEALIRWEHPQKGLISPTNFIPLAEKTGLIKEIGKWTMNTACNQNKIWIQKGYRPIKVSINVSALEFKQNNLVENIKSTLEKIELDSKYIQLEITENTALEDLNNTIKILDELKKMNIKIALDDFGTGYSSLNYLKRLPIDYLKLDKSFIDNVTTKSKDQAITKSLIELAHKIGLKVVAEGIETKEQYHYLKELNCDIGQGYFFNKPLAVKEFEKILDQNLLDSLD